MSSPMTGFDAILNKLSMYKVVAFSLSALLVIAGIFALLGIISISALGLLESVAILSIVCFTTNLGLARLRNIPNNIDSGLITTLILVFVMPPVSDLRSALMLVLAGVVAIASKYLLVYKGSHVFNPAAIGAFAVSLSGLGAVTWWIATPALLPFTLLFGLIILRKTRHFTLFFTFATTALLMMLLVGVYAHGQDVNHVIRTAILSWPLVYFGTVMLTEPSTMPATRYYQILFAVLVGAIFGSQLHISSVSATPQAALLAGNFFAFLVTPAYSAMLKLKSINKLSDTVYDLAFELPTRRLAFIPGQYLEWTLPDGNPDLRGNRRTFSIASSPTEEEVHIGIKRYPRSSSFKTKLLAMQPGQTIRAAHVRGDFTLPDDVSKPLVFIAGGIGITPFRSMIKYLIDNNQHRDIVLFYLATDENDFVYKDVLKESQRVGVRTYLSTGRLAPETIRQSVTALGKTEFYISGPDAMVTHYRQVLKSLKVPSSHIRTDHFTGY